MYYFIESYGYDRLSIEDYKTKEHLILAIRESNAGTPVMLIEGREIKMKWKKMKNKPYWDKSKSLDIPELGIYVPGKPRRKASER